MYRYFREREREKERVEKIKTELHESQKRASAPKLYILNPNYSRDENYAVGAKLSSSERGVNPIAK